MIKSLLVVGLGGFFGSVLRYYIGTIFNSAVGSGFPWGTLAVNLIGCFLIGILSALLGRFFPSDSALALLLTTGFCGGFTTFSTFAHEAVQMLHGGSYLSFCVYVALSVLLGLLLVGFGYWIVK